MLFGLLLAPVTAKAELWKCQEISGGSATFTDTPVFSETRACEKVEGMTYNRGASPQTKQKVATRVAAAKAKRAKETKKSTGSRPSSVPQTVRRKVGARKGGGGRR